MKKIPLLIFLLIGFIGLSQTIVTFKDKKFQKIDVTESNLYVNLTGGEYFKDKKAGSIVKDSINPKSGSIDIDCKVLSVFYPLTIDEEYPTYGRYGDDTRVYCICSEIYLKSEPSPSGGYYWAKNSTYFGRVNMAGIIKVKWLPEYNLVAPRYFIEEKK